MYNYIFYKLYKIAKKTEKQWPQGTRMPVAVAFFSTSILQGFNLLTLLAILSLGLELFKIPSLAPEHAIITMILLYAVNYFLFVRNKKFLQIEERFDKDSKNIKTIKAILFWLYVVLTFVLFFVVLETFKTVQR